MKRTIALAFEDRAHQMVIEALLARIFFDEGEPLDDWQSVVLSSRGGCSLEHAYDYVQRCGKPGLACDLLVIASDVNCKQFLEKRKEVERHLEGYPGRFALALPDPHIERWLILDPNAFQSGVGVARGVAPPAQKCEKDYYKKEINRVLRSEDIVPQFSGGLEFAPAIIRDLDMHVARKDTSFDEFYTSVRACLKGA